MKNEETKSLDRKLIQWFREPKNLRPVRESVIGALFVFLLLGLTLPFNLEDMGEGRYVYIVEMSIITMVVSIVNGLFATYALRLPLDPKLPLRKVHLNSFLHYLVCIPFLAFWLTVYGGYYYCEYSLEPWWHGGVIHLEYYRQFLYYVSSVCLFLYIGTFVRNRNWYLRYQLDEVRAINDLLEQRQIELAEKEEIRQNADDVEASDEKEENTAEPILRLVGNVSNSTIEIPASSMIYIESMANYADIWYLDNDEPRHKMLRITLKQIKENIGDHTFLVQCHRAFIVNLNFVVAMLSRNSGYQLQLFGTDKLVPVSRNNAAAVKSQFMSLLSHC